MNQSPKLEVPIPTNWYVFKYNLRGPNFELMLAEYARKIMDGMFPDGGWRMDYRVDPKFIFTNEADAIMFKLIHG